METPVLDLLRKIVKSRLAAKKNHKPDALKAAKFFGAWLAHWGDKCTEEGAKRMIDIYKHKFIDLMPGTSHKCYEKWTQEAKELNLI